MQFNWWMYVLSGFLHRLWIIIVLLNNTFHQVIIFKKYTINGAKDFFKGNKLSKNMIILWQIFLWNEWLGLLCLLNAREMWNAYRMHKQYMVWILYIATRDLFIISTILSHWNCELEFYAADAVKMWHNIVSVCELPWRFLKISSREELQQKQGTSTVLETVAIPILLARLGPLLWVSTESRDRVLASYI